MKKQPISINGLSELTGLDRRRIKKHLRDMPPDKTHAGSDLYSLPVALRILFAAADKAAGESPEIQRARLRLLQAQGDRQELAFAKDRGELISVDDAFLIGSEVAQTAKRQFLRLPLLASELEGKSAKEINHLLGAEVGRIVEEISRLSDPDIMRPRLWAEAGGEQAHNEKKENE